LPFALCGLLLLAGGCARPKQSGQRDPRANQKDEQRATIELPKGARFVVQDRTGQLVMEAYSDRSVGAVAPGEEGKGPVTFTNPRCTMYKNGKPEMRITGPEAVWRDNRLYADKGAHVETVDGTVKSDSRHAVWADQVVTMTGATALLFKDGQLKVKLSAPEAVAREDLLVAEKTGHAESPDGLLKLDAKKATWKRSEGRLILENATSQQWEKGKQVTAAEGPRVEYQDDWMVLPATGMARRLEDGSTVRADRVRWNRVTAQLEATGHVRLESPGWLLEGEKFEGNTDLQKGRLTGRPHGRLRKAG
jgi:hypothetical protein